MYVPYVKNANVLIAPGVVPLSSLPVLDLEFF